MASLAYYIKKCQSEEKYASEFVSELDSRVQSLNFAQLQGMQEVLSKCSAEAKSMPWRKANEQILQHVNVHIVPRREEVELNEAKKEAVKRKAHVKKLNKEAKLKEKRRVLEQIKQNAALAAVKDVKENEFKRQALDKARLMEEIPVAEAKRNKYFRYIFIYFVILIIIISVALVDPLLVGCGIAFVFISTGIMTYKAYQMGIVHPVVVSEEQLEREKVVRTEELIQKALNTLKQQQIEFDNKMAKDAEERRAYRRQKKKKAEEALQEAESGKGDQIGGGSADPESDYLDDSGNEVNDESADELELGKTVDHNSNKTSSSAEPKVEKLMPSGKNAAGIKGDDWQGTGVLGLTQSPAGKGTSNSDGNDRVFSNKADNSNSSRNHRSDKVHIDLAEEDRHDDVNQLHSSVALKTGEWAVNEMV